MFLVIGFCLIPVASSAVDAANTTADEVKVNFDMVYTDSSGLKWGKKLDGTYTNGCIGTNGRYDFSACTEKVLPSGEKLVGDDSEAVQACIKAGGRLPTIQEYGRMRSDFKSRKDFYATFTDMQGYFFWSASLSPRNEDYARVFYGGNGFTGNELRDDDFSVRCVGR